MYSSIEIITINEKKYYIYKEVLKEYHYFDTILQGKFHEKSIQLDLDISIDFNIVITYMMTYYYTKKYVGVHVNKLRFHEFIELCSILTYLQPKETNMITFFVETYYLDEVDNYQDKINIINNSILSQNHKIIILKNIIKKLNKISLLFTENDQGRSNIDDSDNQKYMIKLHFIDNFFKQFDISVDNYEALIEIRGSNRDCWGIPNGPGLCWGSDSSDDDNNDEYNDEQSEEDSEQNNDQDNKIDDLDKNLVWFEGGSRGYYQEDYAIKQFKINNHIVELINIKEDRDTINFSDTFINFIVKKYLLH